MDKKSLSVFPQIMNQHVHVYISPVAYPGDEIITGDGQVPMAIFELLECIVNEVKH